MKDYSKSLVLTVAFCPLFGLEAVAAPFGYFDEVPLETAIALPPISSLSAGTGGGTSSLASFGIFDIAVSFINGTPSVTQQAAFDDAATFWEARILGYEDPVLAAFISTNFPQLQITADLFSTIDGPGGILGSAGATSVAATGGFTGIAADPANVIVAIAGAMNFDPADIPGLETAGSFAAVIRHEMAHVIGFTDLFWDFVAATDGSGTDTSYVGEIGLAMYNREYGNSDLFVPVEDNGGPGTAFAHWDEDLFAGHLAATGNSQNPELMTGFLDTLPTTLSNTTVASFDDLGYATVARDLALVPVPTSVMFLGSGVLVLGGLRRRSKRQAAA